MSNELEFDIIESEGLDIENCESEEFEFEVIDSKDVSIKYKKPKYIIKAWEHNSGLSETLYYVALSRNWIRKNGGVDSVNNPYSVYINKRTMYQVEIQNVFPIQHDSEDIVTEIALEAKRNAEYEELVNKFEQSVSDRKKLNKKYHSSSYEDVIKEAYIQLQVDWENEFGMSGNDKNVWEAEYGIIDEEWDKEALERIEFQKLKFLEKIVSSEEYSFIHDKRIDVERKYNLKEISREAYIALIEYWDKEKEKFMSQYSESV